MRTLTGSEVEEYIPFLAQLRQEVFADWPYLYEGTAAEEAAYLRHFADASDAVLILAEQNGVPVGAATAAPLEAQDAGIRAPFEAAGETLANWLYLGESVLRADCRGLGIGHRFFDCREAHARHLGRDQLTFCAVMRDERDPRRPALARDLHPFWRGRGYRPWQGAYCRISWTEQGRGMVDNRLQVWRRSLDATG